MAAPLLTLKDVTLGFGGRPLFSGVELTIARGDRIALVGRNGSGKSTLLRVAAGLIEPDAGSRMLRQGASVAYLPQEPDMSGQGRVHDYVVGGLPPDLAAEPHRAAPLIDALSLDGSRDAAGLSGGEARRAALARALVCDPDILLLDEPTNHLDLRAIEWLEARLGGGRIALVMVSHDRAILERVTNATLWLDRGRLLRLDEGYAAFEAWSETILEREAVETAKLDKLIARETAWSHEGITARRRRNQGRLRRLHELRAERARRSVPTGRARMLPAEAGLTGRRVIEADGIAKRLGGRTVIEEFSTRILRGDRVGIIGPNGAGKTTLLRLLVGDMTPDSGRVTLGTNIAMVYLDQAREALDPGRTPWQVLCPDGGDQVMVGNRPRHVVSYLRDFLFAEQQVRSPVESLSGGERNRLLLARALARPSNLLALDEPTNDLDMDTLDLLQELLADYSGTVLLVSHDRDFLDRIVTSTIVIEDDGTVAEYAGGYTDYLRQRPRTARRGPSAGPVPPAAGATATALPRRRLGYKQQRTLERLPGRIAELESTITGLEKELADPDLYGRDRAAFDRLAEQLADARVALAAAEDEWLALEALREQFEADR